MRQDDDRARILERYGAGPAELDQLLTYTESRFQPPDGVLSFPLEDELHVATWRRYAAEAETSGVFPVLQRALAQLRFPIQEGISQTEAYRAATLRGDVPESGGLELRRPESLRLLLHPTPAGTIPALIAPEREDFVALFQALGMRNEPKPIPPSTGAVTVGGLVSWDRVAELRRQWEAENPFAGDAGWSDEMARIRPHKELYQDRVIILSVGPYSGVPAGDMAIDADEWLRLSLSIRLEHECTHYLTRRVFGSMRNNAYDEILADYVGIVRATGAYNPEWLLRFLGLEGWPSYRPGGRLENYRGQPPLSAEAFGLLQALVHDAALALARHPGASFRAGDLQGQGEALLHLSTLTLLELATEL